MKLLELIEDVIICVFAPDFAIAVNLQNKSSVIFEHILKIYLYPNNPSVVHWRQEVYAAMHWVYKLKNKKLPSKRFLMDNLYESWHDALGGFIAHIEEDYSAVEWSNKMYHEFDSMAYNYFDQLSDALCKLGGVSSSEVYQMLDNAGF